MLNSGIAGRQVFARPSRCNRSRAARLRAASAGRWCGRSARRSARSRGSRCRASRAPAAVRGNARICARRSGEALNSTQSVAVGRDGDRRLRARPRADACPCARRRSCGQLQFHCGKPPPAAEPSTLMCISAVVRSGKDESPAWGLSCGARRRLAVGDVHRHLEAETHLGVFRLGPHAVDTSFPLRPDSDRPAAGCPPGNRPIGANDFP